MKAKYTINVPGNTVSPLSIDSKGNIYFSTDKAFYRISSGGVEQILNGVPFRQVTSNMIGLPDWGTCWPPLALLGDRLLLPGLGSNSSSTITMLDPEVGPLWKYSAAAHGVGIVPCLSGCFLLTELSTDSEREYSVEKIGLNGKREWIRKYPGQPFHSFGPQAEGNHLLFFAGDDWARNPILRLLQLDADGKESCIDEFSGPKSFHPLWTKNGGFFLICTQSDAKTAQHEVLKYEHESEKGYFLSNRWFFDDTFQVGDWRVSPSGNYLCHAGGNVSFSGHWTNVVSLFPLGKQEVQKKVFINLDTPMEQSAFPHYAAPLVTDSGIVISSWHTQKSNPLFVTDFSAPEINTYRIRNSKRTTLLMEYHNSVLYLVEAGGGLLYCSAFEWPAS